MKEIQKEPKVIQEAREVVNGYYANHKVAALCETLSLAASRSNLYFAPVLAMSSTTYFAEKFLYVGSNSEFARPLAIGVLALSSLAASHYLVRGALSLIMNRINYFLEVKV